MASRAPLFIFTTSFLTFAAAFGGLMWMSKHGQEPTSVGPAGGGARPRPTPRNAAQPDAEVEAPAVLFGVVSGAEGEPVADATVYLLAPLDDSTSVSERVLDSATTDENGHYEFEPVADGGAYELIVCAKGMARSRSTSELPRAVGTDLGELSVNRGGELVFRVRDERGRAVAGASVTVRDPLANEGVEFARAELQGFTDEEGMLTLEGADFGLFESVVTKNGYDVWQESFPFQVEDQRSRRSVNSTLRTASAFLEGRVVDPVGQPIVAGRVVAVCGRQSGAVEYGADLGEDGRFKLGPLPDGQYELSVQADGVRQKSAVNANTDNAAPVLVEVEYGGIATGRVVSTAPTTAAVQLEVCYEDRHGRLVPYSGTLRKRVDPNSLDFVVDGLSPGHYQVRAASEGFAPARSELFELGAGSKVEGISVRLGPGGRLSGRIVGARGEALQGVRVTAYEGESAPPSAMIGLLGDLGLTQAYTAADGSFSFERLSPGPLSLLFDAKGLPSRTIAPLMVEENGALRLGQLYMGAGASITGSLPVSENSSGNRILVRSADNRTWLLLGAGRSGHYSVQGLPEGRYLVQQLGPDYTPRSDEVEIVLREAEHRRLDFQD